MCKQIKLKIKRRNHGEFPDHNVLVSIEAESVTGYFSAVPVHDEGVPGQFVMHPKDNVEGINDDVMGKNDIAAGKNDIVVNKNDIAAGKNDIAAGTNHIATCFHEIATVLSRIVTFPSEGEVIVKMMKIKKIKNKRRKIWLEKKQQ